MVINGNMGRKRKKFRKIYDLDDFSLEITIYNKKVVFFHLKFCIKRDSKEPIRTEDVKHQFEKILSDKFNSVQGRKIFDVDNCEMMRGYIAYITLSGYFEIFEDYEEYIISKCNEIIPQIRVIANKYGEITKRTAKKKCGEKYQTMTDDT